ncbi:5-formyltetrahydrofolate cyclo-ligase [Georgenia sp. Z1491]|uniref:5-formyltetrahydrofolate cyclo-ligase n=1 Tax=Georgenia sp. Z1491 TaxID=3416707 RepID=UPI003CF8FFBC
MVAMHRRILDLPRVDHLEVDDAKQLLREAVREHRGRQPDTGRARAGLDIARRVLPLLDGARTVAHHVARPSEPPSLPTIETLHETGVRILLPALGPGLARAWAVYRGTDDLAERAPGRPLEPSGAPLPSETIAEADIVIVPALAVDRHGNRLGQGGGWYDRVLKLIGPETAVWAVLFDDELVETTLPHGPQDVRVTGVVQPSGTTSLLPPDDPYEATASGGTAPARGA